MTWHERISGLLSTDEDTTYHTEEFLNVFRESEEVILGSSEVAEDLGVTPDGARKRLKKLKENDQIDGRKIGDSWVWTLPQDARQKPVPPEYDRLVNGLEHIKDRVRLILTTALAFGVVGLGFLYAGVTEAVVVGPVSAVSPVVTAAVGWSFALSGALFVFVALLAIGGLNLIEWVTVRQAAKESRRSGAVDGSRGQAGIWLLLARFVLLLLAVPLVQFAVTVQQRLAGTQLFSSEAAAFLAVLLVAAIVLAIVQEVG